MSDIVSKHCSDARKDRRDKNDGARPADSFLMLEYALLLISLWLDFPPRMEHGIITNSTETETLFHLPRGRIEQTDEAWTRLPGQIVPEEHEHVRVPERTEKSGGEFTAGGLLHWNVLFNGHHALHCFACAVPKTLFSAEHFVPGDASSRGQLKVVHPDDRINGDQSWTSV